MVNLRRQQYKNNKSMTRHVLKLQSTQAGEWLLPKKIQSLVTSMSKNPVVGSCVEKLSDLFLVVTKNPVASSI